MSTIQETITKLWKLHNPEITTIKELEKAIGLSNGQFRKWDTSQPSVSSLRRIASFFNVPIQTITGEELPDNNLSPDQLFLAQLIPKNVQLDEQAKTFIMQYVHDQLLLSELRLNKPAKKEPLD